MTTQRRPSIAQVQPSQTQCKSSSQPWDYRQTDSHAANTVSQSHASQAPRKTSELSLRRASVELRLQPEHVCHAVLARRLRHHPARRSQRSACKDLPRGGTMSKLDALATAQQHDGVIANDIPATHGQDP